MLHKVIDYICHRFALIYAFGSFAFIESAVIPLALAMGI